MSRVKCKCGCVVFEQFIPVMFDETDFRAWDSGREVKPEVRTIPVIRCLRCSRITIPPTSMVGKNQMHPEVQAFKELIDYVDEYNKVLDTYDKNIEVIQKNINRTIAIEERLNGLTNVAQKDPVEVTPNVQAGKRGRKTS